MNEGIIYVVLFTILLFFLFREVACWYWKINKRLEIEQQILEELRKLNDAKLPNKE